MKTEYHVTVTLRDGWKIPRLREEWYRANTTELHRDHGPAVTETEAATGKILHQEWRRNGELHREGDLPALIDDTQKYFRIEAWYLDGKEFRADKPSRIVTDFDTNRVIQEGWCTDSNVDGPSRLDGPAFICRHSDTGVMTREIWSRGGHCHRDDGYAMIYRDEYTGEITEGTYYQNGDEVPSLPNLPPPKIG